MSKTEWNLPFVVSDVFKDKDLFFIKYDKKR